MLARRQRALGVENLGARGHGDHDLALERLRRAGRHARADPIRDERAPGLVDVPDERRDTARDEHPCGLGAVHATSDDGVRGRLGAAERVGGENAGRGCPQGGDGSRLEHREQTAVIRVREQHQPRHRRQPARRVPREGRDPLEERVPVADCRHRAEVAGRVVRDVDLRRHRPRAASVGLECDADRVVGLVR